MNRPKGAIMAEESVGKIENYINARIWGFRSANLVISPSVLLASLLVDGNGNYPGMGDRQSIVLTVVLFATGLGSNVLILVYDHNRIWKGLALLFLLLSAWLLIPYFAP